MRLYFEIPACMCLSSRSQSYMYMYSERSFVPHTGIQCVFHRSEKNEDFFNKKQDFQNFVKQHVISICFLLSWTESLPRYSLRWQILYKAKMT